jgi:hypothetical protein
MAFPILPLLLLGGAGAALVMLNQKKPAVADSPAPGPVTSKGPAASKPDCAAADAQIKALYCEMNQYLAGYDPVKDRAAIQNALADYVPRLKALKLPANCGPYPYTPFGDYHCPPVQGRGIISAKAQADYVAQVKAASGHGYSDLLAYQQGSTGAGGTTNAGAHAFSDMAAYDQQQVAASNWGPGASTPATAAAPTQNDALSAWLAQQVAKAPAPAPITATANPMNAYLQAGGGKASAGFKFGV